MKVWQAYGHAVPMRWEGLAGEFLCCPAARQQLSDARISGNPKGSSVKTWIWSGR